MHTGVERETQTKPFEISAPNSITISIGHGGGDGGSVCVHQLADLNILSNYHIDGI